MIQISGKVKEDGVSSSNHYTSTKVATGVYAITFTTPLDSAPTVLLTTNTEDYEASSFYVVGASVKDVLNTGFTVNIANFNNPATDSGFNFLAIV
ncbi:MAG: hypothetical protein ACJAUV_002375 [Flavobacteriales bacterium]|jgi:hypothetical protein